MKIHNKHESIILIAMNNNFGYIYYDNDTRRNLVYIRFAM